LLSLQLQLCSGETDVDPPSELKQNPHELFQGVV